MKISVGTFCKARQMAKISLPFCLLPFAICLLIFNFSGCGKIGDPLPPIPRAPLVVEELRVEQQGAQLNLSFPFTRTPRSVRLQRIDIYRLTETTGDALGLTQESFSARAHVIASIPAEQIPLKKSMIN